MARAQTAKGTLAGLAAALCWVGLGTACGGASAPRSSAPREGCTPRPYTRLRSRPDLDGAPGACVVVSTPQARAGGDIFLTPGGRKPVGPAIYGVGGHLLWFHPVPKLAVHDLEVVKYQGRQLLAWWEGTVGAGHGVGTYYLYDDHYHLVRTIRAADGAPLDLHELLITARGDALVDRYVPIKMDLAKQGGAPDTTVYEGVLQEIDLATGKLVFSWSSLDHVGLDESVVKPPTKPGKPYDYFHINSIAVDPADGNFIVSARNTSSIYEIDHRTGAIVWRICGTHAAACPGPRLRLVPSTESFWFQHDARPGPGSTLSLFDDGGAPFQHDARGLVVRIDLKAGTAMVERTYGASLKMRVAYAGDLQPLPGGDWLIGWGSQARATEVSSSGEVIFDMAFTGDSYRARRFTWTGVPSGPPTVAAKAGADGTTTVWASWNGATEVRRWRVLAGPNARSLRAAGTFAWSDFETAMDLRTRDRAVEVEALGPAGRVLGDSKSVTVTAG